MMLPNTFYIPIEQNNNSLQSWSFAGPNWWISGKAG